MEQELLERLQNLETLVYHLETRIEYLESENVGSTNEIYELHNKLDILNHPKYINLKNYLPGDA